MNGSSRRSASRPMISRSWSNETAGENRVVRPWRGATSPHRGRRVRQRPPNRSTSTTNAILEGTKKMQRQPAITVCDRVTPRNGAARGARGCLSADRAFRLGRSHLHASVRPSSRRRSSLPDQPLRHDLRRGHGFQPGQGRPEWQEGRRFTLRHQSGGLHHSQRDPCSARERKLRAPCAQHQRHGSVGTEARRAADLAAIHLRAVVARVITITRAWRCAKTRSHG